MSNSPILNIPGIENGTADGNTLRWEASTGRWEETTSLVVADDGNVGIGAADPLYRLGVHAAADSYIHLTNDTTGELQADGLLVGCDASAARFIYREASPMQFWTSNSERMRIDAAGNVGIGTDTPVAPLQVGNITAGTPTGLGADLIVSGGQITTATLASGTNLSDSVLKLDFRDRYVGADGQLVGSIAVERAAGGANNWSMTFATGTGVQVDAVEQMRITSAGNVGIGTAAPTTALQLGDTATAVNRIITMANTSTGSKGYYVGVTVNGDGLVYTSSATPIRFGTTDTERMRIDASGNLLVGTISAGPNNERLVAESSSPAFAFYRRVATGGVALGTFRADVAGPNTSSARILSDGSYQDDIALVNYTGSLQAVDTYLQAMNAYIAAVETEINNLGGTPPPTPPVWGGLVS